jgi:hypothetical protein
MIWDFKALVRKPPSSTKLISPHILAEIHPFDLNLHVLYLDGKEMKGHEEKMSDTPTHK